MLELQNNLYLESDLNYNHIYTHMSDCMITEIYTWSLIKFI